MLTMLYIMFNGYPSDKVVLPLTIVLTILAVKMALKEVVKEIRGLKHETN